MRSIFIGLCSALAACSGANDGGVSRSDAVVDMQSYAVASCLSEQAQPYLHDQGDAWAAAIVQRMKGDTAPLAEIAASVEAEIAKGGMAVIHNESGPNPDKTLPVMYCGEIIDQPGVRAAVEKAVEASASAYR